MQIADNQQEVNPPSPKTDQENPVLLDNQLVTFHATKGSLSYLAFSVKVEGHFGEGQVALW